MQLKFLMFGVAALSALAYAAPGVAQEYPNRPIHIVTGETGGGLDLAARLIAPLPPGGH